MKQESMLRKQEEDETRSFKLRKFRQNRLLTKGSSSKEKVTGGHSLNHTLSSRKRGIYRRRCAIQVLLYLIRSIHSKKHHTNNLKESIPNYVFQEFW